MNYLALNHNTFIWFHFIIYALTIIFLISNNNQNKAVLKTAEADNEKELQFASKMVLRTVLLPMLFLIKKRYLT